MNQPDKYNPIKTYWREKKLKLKTTVRSPLEKKVSSDDFQVNRSTAYYNGEGFTGRLLQLCFCYQFYKLLSNQSAILFSKHNPYLPEPERTFYRIVIIMGYPYLKKKRKKRKIKIVNGKLRKIILP